MKKWHCESCGNHDGIHGGIVKQLGKSTAIAGCCRWCGDRPKVLLKEAPEDKNKPETKPENECAH